MQRLTANLLKVVIKLKQLLDRSLELENPVRIWGRVLYEEHPVTFISGAIHEISI
jgi:hypothetical protein